jgi:homoserine kinase
MSIQPIRVRVPATAANLGPGFDVLGLALALYNEFSVRPGDAPLRITVEGAATMLPAGPSNLFYRAFAHLHAEVNRPVPPLDVTMQLQIPPGSGLGSSATAVVGGLLAANAWLGEPLDRAALLPLAVGLEHGSHPDNVAPALLGGLVVNTVAGEAVHSVRVPFPETIKAVIYLPDFMMDTVQGRALMPAAYPKADVVFSTSRVALLLAALQTGHYDLLGEAMADRLHQPYRAQLFPALPDLLVAARAAGAYGACLSGGGSTVLALTPAGPACAAVAAAFERTARAAGLTGRAAVLDVDTRGAVVEGPGGEV